MTATATPTGPSNGPGIGSPPPVRVTEPFTAIACGATGDLTARKLVPTPFRLWRGGFFGARVPGGVAGAVTRGDRGGGLGLSTRW